MTTDLEDPFEDGGDAVGEDEVAADAEKGHDDDGVEEDAAHDALDDGEESWALVREPLRGL